MADITITATQVRPQSALFIAEPAVAGEALTVGNLVQINGSGVAVKADADTAAGQQGTLGLVISGASGRRTTDGSIASGEAISVLLFGLVFVGASAALDETKTLYASGTAGAITDAAPTLHRVVGTVWSTTTILFNPAPAAAASVVI